MSEFCAAPIWPRQAIASIVGAGSRVNFFLRWISLTSRNYTMLDARAEILSNIIEFLSAIAELPIKMAILLTFRHGEACLIRFCYCFLWSVSRWCLFLHLLFITEIQIFCGFAKDYPWAPIPHCWRLWIVEQVIWLNCGKLPSLHRILILAINFLQFIQYLLLALYRL